MVCSNCGSENPATNRFCGMCGTPLPQRPITAPGATSTWSFTRLPIESPQSPAAPPVKPVVPQKPAEPVPTVRSEATEPPPPAEPVASQPLAQVATEVVPEELKPLPPSEPHTFAPKPLVPDIAPARSRLSQAQTPEHETPQGHNYFAEAERATSLEQFVAQFHYTPPSEEDELTMTGDKPVVEGTPTYQPAAPAALTDEPSPLVEPAILSPGSQVESAPPVLAKETAVEPLPAQRSGFLDLSDRDSSEKPTIPIAEAPRSDSARSGTSSIVGPSFLGLSDPPPSTPPADLVAESEPRSHWRAWVAVLVILLFGGLGYMEWRAQKYQDNSGPIEVMKMQIQRLKGRKGAVITPDTSGQPAATPSETQPAQGAGSTPDMQVVPQQKPAAPPTGAPDGKTPQQGTPAGANPGTATSSPAPSAGQVTPGGGTDTPEVSRQTQSAAPSTTSANSSEAAQPAATASSDNTANGQQTRTKPPVPGAEELAKADNASDAAAASAWLWKAVAKGNPEAPVRLANMYIKGDGVAKSCEQALVLLKSAAVKENAAARSKLGSLYATGTCVPRDRVRAYSYMSSALDANPNATWARDFREQLWEQMSPQERSQAQKFR